MDSLRICWWIRDFIDIISVYFGQKKESSKTEGIHGKQPNLWFMDMIIITINPINANEEKVEYFDVTENNVEKQNSIN